MTGFELSHNHCPSTTLPNGRNIFTFTIGHREFDIRYVASLAFLQNICFTAFTYSDVDQRTF